MIVMLTIAEINGLNPNSTIESKDVRRPIAESAIVRNIELNFILNNYTNY
jgi:hypothetical protein